MALDGDDDTQYFSNVENSEPHMNMTKEEFDEYREDGDSSVKYEPHLRCNFCGKGAERLFLLIQGPGVNICDECIIQSMGILTKEVVRRETKLEKVVQFNEENG